MQQVLWSTLVLCAPLALILVACIAHFQPGLRPAAVLLASKLATLLVFVLAVSSAVAVAGFGPATVGWQWQAGLGLDFRMDALSVILYLLVSFVGLIVVRFSRNYLDGDPRQGAFIGNLCLTLAAVLLLVTAGNLVLFVLAWIFTSLSLHRLLVFYPERTAALRAARKKFIVARVGDVCLIAAAWLLYAAFDTGDIATILVAAKEGVVASDHVPVAAGLLAVAALLKSAQFPVHGWLPEVMETPTPVSALLHAGIINAGGFLVIRFADVMLSSPAAMHLLAIIGGFTALFGGLVMLTQSSVKVSLAWSTVAQMGFMLLQCGLGAFALAVLHLVAHSLYKAHAFLSSGSVIDISRNAWLPDLHAKPRATTPLLSLLLAGLLYFGISSMLGVSAKETPVMLALGAILILGVSLLISEAFRGRPAAYVIGRVVLSAAGATVAYLVLQRFSLWLLTPTLPPIPPVDGVRMAILLLAVLSFAVVAIMQILAPWWLHGHTGRRLRVHLANGLYANTLFDRLVGAAVGEPALMEHKR